MADDWRKNVMCAVGRDGDSTRLQQLLRKSDQQTLNYRIGVFSPLIEAVVYNSNSCNIIEQLLLAGADVDFPCDYGLTPLMRAVISENIRGCELLLKHGANVHAISTPDLTVLCCAIQNPRYGTKPNIEIIALLLAHGAQIYDPSKWPVHSLEIEVVTDFSTPLHLAVRTRMPCILEMFLDHSDKINLVLPCAELFYSCLWFQAEECAIMMLQQGYYPKASHIARAAKLGFTNLLSLMIEINPHHCLQSKWLISQTFSTRLAPCTDFISLLVESRKQPLSLTQHCKSVILAWLDAYYLRRGWIDELPLPKLLKTFLKKM